MEIVAFLLPYQIKWRICFICFDSFLSLDGFCMKYLDILVIIFLSININTMYFFFLHFIHINLMIKKQQKTSVWNSLSIKKVLLAMQFGGCRCTQGTGELPRCSFSKYRTDCKCYRSGFRSHRQCSFSCSNNGNVWFDFFPTRFRLLAACCFLRRHRRFHAYHWLRSWCRIYGNGKGGFLLVS